MENYKGIILTVAPSEGGECLVILDQEKGLIRPVPPDSVCFKKGTFEGKTLHEISFLGYPSPEPWHPEDVAMDISSLSWIKMWNYNQVKNILTPYVMDPKDFCKLFGDSRVFSYSYRGNSIFILPFSKEYKMIVSEVETPYPYPVVKKRAYILIDNLKLPITYWFDRSFWYSLRPGDTLTLAKEDGFIIITLSRLFYDGYCYLLCSGILSPYRIRKRIFF